MENSLEHYFSQPTDLDVAQFKLGAILGFWSINDNFRTDLKGIFYTDNPIGNNLYSILENLINIDVLKWTSYHVVQYNPNFKYMLKECNK
jgi:hypothetical protein